MYHRIGFSCGNENDLQSQMIFNSVKDKEEYQLRIHNEDAQNAKYF